MKSIPSFMTALAVSVLLALPVLAEVRIAALEGPVDVGSGAPPVWSAASVGQILVGGERVRTGQGGRAELALDSGRSARIYENSVLRLPAESAAPGAHLARGHSIFDVTPGMSPNGFEVRTPEVVVSVKGTRFMVAAPEDGDHGTSVFRGAVEMGAVRGGGDAVRVVPGLMALMQEGRIQLRETPFDDPWDSFGAIAPSLARPDGVGAAQQELTRRVVVESGRLETALRAAGVERIAVAPPAAAADAAAAVTADAVPSMDPAADVRRKASRAGMLSHRAAQMPMMQMLQNNENASSGGGGNVPPGLPPNVPFSFELTTSGGPNQLLISFAGFQVTLLQSDITKIQSGDLTPYGPFLQAIQALGIDPVELANFIDAYYF